eukprot:jgi/Mesvir1/22610/Mv14056-RA.1
MFWRAAGAITTSPVDAILERASFTLEELLDQDDLIQECKSQNAALLDYLRGAPQVEALVRYLVEEPPEDASATRRYKYPYVASEIFVCEIENIYNVLVKDEKLLAMFFSFLDRPAPLHSLYAGYFSKVCICLLHRRPDETTDYIKAHPSILSALVRHVGTTSLLDVLMRLTGADNPLSRFQNDTSQWLVETELLDQLLDTLHPSGSPEEDETHVDAYVNVSDLLVALSRNPTSPLTQKLLASSSTHKLMDALLSEHTQPPLMVRVLAIVSSLLEPPADEPANTDLVDVISLHLARLVQKLRAPPQAGAQISTLDTTYGKLIPPLGVHRLKLVGFISALVHTGQPAALNALVQTGAIAACIDLFFEYPFHNALHTAVKHMVLWALQNKPPNGPLLQHVLVDTGLLTCIATSDGTLPSSDKWPNMEAKNLRAGFMGHLQVLANKILEAAATCSVIAELLKGQGAWEEFVASKLPARNDLWDPNKWGCGRPPSIEDPCHLDSDSEEELRDSHFGGLSSMGSGMGTSSYNGVYSRYSVFDRDDGENQVDEDEHIPGAHGRADDKEEDTYYANVRLGSLQLGSGGANHAGRVLEDAMTLDDDDGPFGSDRARKYLASGHDDDEEGNKGRGKGAGGAHGSQDGDDDDDEGFGHQVFMGSNAYDTFFARPDHEDLAGSSGTRGTGGDVGMGAADAFGDDDGWTAFKSGTDFMSSSPDESSTGGLHEHAHGASPMQHTPSPPPPQRPFGAPESSWAAVIAAAGSSSADDVGGLPGLLQGGLEDVVKSPEPPRWHQPQLSIPEPGSLTPGNGPGGVGAAVGSASPFATTPGTASSLELGSPSDSWVAFADEDEPGEAMGGATSGRGFGAPQGVAGQPAVEGQRGGAAGAVASEDPSFNDINYWKGNLHVYDDPELMD